MVESQSQSNPAPSLSLSRGTFVGRHQEMGELRTALEDARSGRGRLVMLAGEPGIGKSRAAQEIGAYAELQGSRVLWGRCYEEQGTPAYWPWIQAIRTYVREQDGESIRDAMGPGASDIAAIIPELRDKLPDLEHPPDLEPEQATMTVVWKWRLWMSPCSVSECSWSMR